MYYDENGNSITLEQIREAVEAGTARIIYSRAENHTAQCLSLNSEDVDTRNECHSVWDERWTKRPTLHEALGVARG